MIENGSISAAIVGVTNLVLRPELQFQFQGINRLNRSVYTNSLDSNGNQFYKIIMYTLILNKYIHLAMLE